MLLISHKEGVSMENEVLERIEEKLKKLDTLVNDINDLKKDLKGIRKQMNLIALEMDVMEKISKIPSERGGKRLLTPRYRPTGTGCDSVEVEPTCEPIT